MNNSLDFKQIIKYRYIFLLSLTLSTISGYSCTCSEKNKIEEEYNKSQVVFTGELITTRDTSIPDKEPNFPGFDYIIYEFKVNEVLKGENNRYEILSPKTTETCGFIFHQGDQYLIYAYNKDGLLYTTYCNRTALKDQSLNEIRFIKENLLENKYRMDINATYLILVAICFLIIVIILKKNWLYSKRYF